MLPVQSKMARTALGLGVRDLAALAQVSPDTVARLERGDPLKSSTVETIRAALEAAGVEFIPENGGGAGVRLKKAPPTAETIAEKIASLEAKAAELHPGDGPPSPTKALKTMKRAVVKNEVRKLKNKLVSTKQRSAKK